jgi:hypothetical protein
LLYNPSWKKDRTAGLDDLILWLAAKNPDEQYNYYDSSSCPACQYNASLGKKYRYPKYVLTLGFFDRQLETIAAGSRCRSDHTYGAMSDRAIHMKNSWLDRWIG